MNAKERITEKNDQRPVVCATDFSATAVEAADVAAEMARRLNVKLFLFHVEEFRGLAVTDPSLFELVVSKNRAALDREADRLRKAGTIVAENLLSGPVFEELVNAAIELNARLVVLGAVGHGVARRLLVGSVAERVAETSPIPTLVVRPGGKLIPWIRGQQPLKVLVGYDFSPASDAALRWVNQMQAVNPCETVVVHIDWPPEQAKRLGYNGPLGLTENPEQIQNFLERDLSERVAMQLPPENVTIMVEPGWGRTESHLYEIAHREKADLVVVGTNRRHGWGRLRFGSVSRAVLHYAAVPVLVAPPVREGERTATPKLERVLVATDFSDLGNKAIPYGCALLRRGGILKLVHVLNSEAAETNGEPRPRMKNPKLSARLRALVPADATATIQIEEEIAENTDPAEAIAQEAERFRADAICLGSHGRTGLGKAFLGSVTEGVMTRSRRPVLIVRADQE